MMPLAVSILPVGSEDSDAGLSVPAGRKEARKATTAPRLDSLSGNTNHKLNQGCWHHSLSAVCVLQAAMI
jgi:hypothetical protein